MRPARYPSPYVDRSGLQTIRARIGTSSPYEFPPPASYPGESTTWNAARSRPARSFDIGDTNPIGAINPGRQDLFSKAYYPGMMKRPICFFTRKVTVRAWHGANGIRMISTTQRAPRATVVREAFSRMAESPPVSTDGSIHRSDYVEVIVGRRTTDVLVRRADGAIEHHDCLSGATEIIPPAAGEGVELTG